MGHGHALAEEVLEAVVDGSVGGVCGWVHVGRAAKGEGLPGQELPFTAAPGDFRQGFALRNTLDNYPALILNVAVTS